MLFYGKQNVLMIGHHRSRISHDAVASLLAAFRAADYFSLKDKYAAMITDNPTCTTSLEFDGYKKSVQDYVGFAAGMPEVVDLLEGKIEEVAGTDKWIRETPQSAPSLLAEGWDFKAHSPENLTLFTHAIQWRANSVVNLFIQQGAPLLESPPKGMNALKEAAIVGNTALVSRFLRAQPGLSPRLLASALDSAAEGGSLPTVRLIIANGARVDGSTLIAAAYSGNLAVIREILKYHPDLNATASSGDTALAVFLKYSLFQSHALQIVTTLVHAGADPSFRDNEGQTLAQMARDQDDTKAAAFLEAAAKAHKRAH